MKIIQLKNKENSQSIDSAELKRLTGGGSGGSGENKEDPESESEDLNQKGYTGETRNNNYQIQTESSDQQDETPPSFGHRERMLIGSTTEYNPDTFEQERLQFKQVNAREIQPLGTMQNENYQSYMLEEHSGGTFGCCMTINSSNSNNKHKNQSSNSEGLIVYGLSTNSNIKSGLSVNEMEIDNESDEAEYMMTRN